MANAEHGMIAVDKMGGKVLFLNPVTYKTEVVIDGFPKTVHELLIVPETGMAYVPIFGDGIHGRNPNPQHLLCVFDLHKRAHAATIDLRGLKCPLPALRTRKALSRLEPGSTLVVECTDPLAEIDIPNLVRETGDILEDRARCDDVLVFRIRKRSA